MIVDTSKKQLWVLLIAEFLLMIGTSISQPFWPILIKSKIGTSHLSFNIWNTSVYLLPLLFSAISAPLWGSMADRYGYKKLFLREFLAHFGHLLLMNNAYLSNFSLFFCIFFLN